MNPQKLFLVPTFCVFFCAVLMAQNAKNLSYTQIDSFMNLHYNKGAYEKAMSYLEIGREKAKQEFGTQDSIFANYTYELGYFHMEIGQYKEAETLYTEAKNIQAKILGTNHPKYGHTLNDIGLLYNTLGQFDQAKTFFMDAKDIFAKSVGVEHADYANVLNNLANLYQKTGQYDLALPLFIEAKNIQAKVLGKDHPNYANSLNGLAALYYNMGLYEHALPLFLEAKTAQAKSLGTNHPDYANTLNSLAYLYQSMGQYEQAHPLYFESKNIRAQTFGTNHPHYASSLNNLASLYKKMGKYDLAQPLFLESLRIKAQTVGTNHPDYAGSLNNLAVLYQEMGQYEQAHPLFLEAKNIKAKFLGLDHPSYTTSLNNLALLYLNMKEYEKAHPLFLEAKETRAKILGVSHPSYALSLHNLAGLYQSMAQHDLAWLSIHEAIQSSSNVLWSGELTTAWKDSLLHANYASRYHLENMMGSLLIIYDLLGKDSTSTTISQQIIVADLATALLKKLRESHTGSEDKLRLLSQSSDWLLRSLKLLDKNKQANIAFELAEQNKSVLLLDASKAERAYEIGDLPDSLIRQEKEFFKQKDKLQAKLVEKGSEEQLNNLRTSLNQVNQDIEDFKRKIEKEYPHYAKLKYQHIDAKVEDVQKLLDSKTAFLEYVIGDSVVYIFYVDQHHLKWIEKPLDNKELTKKIKELHYALSNYQLLSKKAGDSYKLYTETAYWFYQKLLEPVLSNTKDISKQDLSQIEKLIIVTDGELGHLPFEAFLVEFAPQSQTEYSKLHYLVNDYSISYNYSATLWKENKEDVKLHTSNNGKVLAMASNYNTNAILAQKSFRLPVYEALRKTLIPLPQARKEVGILQENFQGFFGIDSMATEKIFKEKAGDYAIIHLAMHGLLDSKAPVLSSLVFTEDGDSLEDNFLQAYEISKLKLNADLVILSACETGYGKFEKGNGIASLARAFMYAGASSLIVSLWQVNDFATSEIMKRLYQNLNDGMDKAEALRQAKLGYVQSANGIAAHPAFWSPFILMGDDRPIKMNTNSLLSTTWIMIGGLILVLVGCLVFIKKRSNRAL